MDVERGIQEFSTEGFVDMSTEGLVVVENKTASSRHQVHRSSVYSDMKDNNPNSATEYYQMSNRRSSSVVTNEIASALNNLRRDHDSRRASIKISNSRFKMMTKNILPRKLSEEQRLILRKKFIRAIKLSVWAVNWCKWAYNYNVSIRDKYLSFSQMFDFDEPSEQQQQSKGANVEESSSDFVSFNKEYFKSKRKANTYFTINGEIKQILTKRNGERTKNDIEALRTSFKHLKSVNSLPLEMQNRVYRRCWLETYEPKRVIIRQDHRAEAFYFILSGSLVVTNKPENSKYSFTVCFLEAGMSFGELALLSKSARTSTVISRTRVQLLVISKEDFNRIFAGGNNAEKLLKEKTMSDFQQSRENIIERAETHVTGKSSKTDLSHIEFLKGLKFLNGWSFDELNRNPQQAVFCYFPRGQVLVRNGNLSKYVYIVKKGSISVWIKVRRKKENLDDASTIRKYLAKRDSNAPPSTKAQQELEESEFYSNSSESMRQKDDDIAINSKLGATNTYFESDKFLKEQHEEAVRASLTDDTDLKKMQNLKHESAMDTKTRTRLNQLMEYLEMTKGTTNNKVETRMSKGVKTMPGVLDKRDKLKILDHAIEKENTIMSNHGSERIKSVKGDQQANDADPDEKTFSKGKLHLPKIRVQKVNKKAELRKSFDYLSSRNASHSDIFKSADAINEDRRNSTYMVKLPQIGDPSKPRKSVYDIPKNKYKTTIELMESAEANTRRESMLPSHYDELSKKNKHLNVTSAVLKALPQDSTVENKNLLLPFDNDLLKKENSDEYTTEYIEVQVLETGSHFGLAEILFESQPNMSLVSNGCDCILLPKDLFIKNSTTTYIRSLRRNEIPFPTMPEITRSFNEFSSWKKYASQLASEAVVNTRRHKRNQELKLSKSQLAWRREQPEIFKSSLY